MGVGATADPARRDADQLTPQELARLLEVSRGLGSLHDFDQVLDKVVEVSRDLLGTEMSTLLLVDEREQHLRVVAHRGIDPEVARRLSTPIGKNLSGLVAATGIPVRCTDIAKDERSTLGRVCEGHIRSGVLVPLIFNGRVLGVLAVETNEERAFSGHEEGILTLLADQAATAIESARLYAVEHDQVEQLQTLIDRIKVQNDAMRRSREAHTRLAEAALEGGGLGTLVRVLVGLVPAPITVVNQFGADLAGAAPEGDDRLAELWEGCRSLAAFSRDLERLRANAGFAHAAPRPESGFWRLVPIAAAGEVLGAIVVLDHEELAEEHVLILEEAASIVATELLRERSVAEVEARSHGDLVQTLLCSDADPDSLGERAALLGHDLTACQAVVAIVPAGDSRLPKQAAITSAGQRAVARAGLRGIFGCAEGAGVAILSGGDRSLCREGVERWIEAFREELRGRAEGVDLQFGVSEIECEGRAVREGFAHARQAAAMCRLRGADDVTCFEDVQLIASLIDITDEAAIERFIEHTIGRLEEYDSRKQTHLARTLETYLDCSGVARHAAQALFLHPHSLRYRLRRIAEIQGIDLEDPMARLTSHLALKLRAIVGSGA